MRLWPRDPKGPDIPSPLPLGKQVPNGHPTWGSTVSDFYYVNRFASIPGYRTVTSGSKLAAWAREVGELDWAVDELDQADQEEDPKEVPPCDIAMLIRDHEWRAECIPAIGGIPLKSVINASATGSDTKQSSNSSTQTENPGSNPRTCMNTLFASMSNGSQDQPGPWPLVPFSGQKPLLQKRIPIHLLPQKLVVHDPWGLLAIKEEDIQTSDSEMEVDGEDSKVPDLEMQKKWVDNDVVQVYRLRLSEAGKKRAEEEKRAIAKEAEASRSSTSKKGYILESENDTTAYLVIPPERPPQPESTPEAHLYLSPAHCAGKGHHSVVYHAELELPRSLLTGELMCETCLFAKASEMIVEIKKNPIATPKETVSPTNVNEKPIHAIYPDVKWQNPERGPLCSHLRRTENVPLTTKVGIVAKLSVPEDSHLLREGRNYQSFPDCFFEHWNGYNLIHPLTDPVPLGAVVPQFYGYYVPAKQQNQKKDQSDVDMEYLSPILLIEDCGIPVDVSKLDYTDRTDCVSLLYRFHNEDWIHDSFYERNILMQPGPLTEWPAFRHIGGTNVFRLIDFGRSRKLKDNDTNTNIRYLEHRRAANLFGFV